MKNRFTWFLYLVVIALAAEVVFLVIQNRRLQAQIVLLRNFRPPETLKVGDKVVPINVRSLDGNMKTLSYGSSSPTRRLYVFNTRCPSCQYTLPIWKNLAAEMPASVQVLAVTSDSLEATIKYQQRHALNYPVFVAADTLFKRSYKIPYVPQTMLLDGNGTVQGIWSGVLQDSQIVRIREIVQNR